MFVLYLDMSKKYYLFISHSWTYGDPYSHLIKWFDEDDDFIYSNFSVPKDDPIHTNGTDKQLEEAIDNKLKLCNVVLIMAGVYSSYSKWINKEIAIAVKYKKPIIAIEPWGSERTSQEVKNAATKIVKWQKKSIKDAIRESVP